HRVGDDELEADHLVQQGVGFRVDPGRTEVVADAIAKRARLADVDRVATRVEVQIDPGLLRQPGNLLLEIVDGHTVLCRVFTPCLNPPLYDTRPTRRFASAARSPGWSARSACSRCARSSTRASRCGFTPTR